MLQRCRSPLLALLGISALVAETSHTQAAGDEVVVGSDPFRPAVIVTENVPVIPEELIIRLREYQNVRAARFRGWGPDGRGILVQTRFANADQLHRVYEPGGRREQVTFFDEPTDGRFLPGPDTETLLLSSSAGGNENYQIYRHDGGRATVLFLQQHLLGDSP